MNKKLIFSIIVVIIAIAAVFAYQKYNKPEEISSNIDTSDWLTYRNEELGISFEYDAFSQFSHKKHIIKKENNSVTLFVDGNNFGNSIDIFSIKEGQSPKDFLYSEFMKNIDSRCDIEEKIPKNIAGGLSFPYNYSIFVISGVTYSNNDGPYFLDCGLYGNINGIAFFLYNKGKPNKILWVSLGQDSSLEHYKDFLSSIRIF